ncbi:MAG TPA: hypothetical protein VFF13_01755 [archaeon]|nr:hypothetical protein [archaeon]
MAKEKFGFIVSGKKKKDGNLEIRVRIDSNRRTKKGEFFEHIKFMPEIIEEGAFQVGQTIGKVIYSHIETTNGPKIGREGNLIYEKNGQRLKPILPELNERLHEHALAILCKHYPNAQLNYLPGSAKEVYARVSRIARDERRMLNILPNIWHRRYRG